jgi:predicted ester cyclase
MSVEENKAIARRLVEEGWNNPDTLDEILAVDIVWGPDEGSGLENYKKGFPGQRLGCPDYHYDLEDIIAEGDKVVAKWKFTGTHTGEWFGAPPTGNQVTVCGISTFRLEGGKVVEQWSAFNSYWMWQQFGVIPSLEEAIKQAQSKLG